MHRITWRQEVHVIPKFRAWEDVMGRFWAPVLLAGAFVLGTGMSAHAQKGRRQPWKKAGRSAASTGGE
jgi:hypothetical protein